MIVAHKFLPMGIAQSEGSAGSDATHGVAVIDLVPNERVRGSVLFQYP